MKTTIAGTPCRATAAWRCTGCERILCGVHISRGVKAARCSFCQERVLQLGQRALKRRASDRPALARTEPAAGGPTTGESAPRARAPSFDPS